MGHTQPPTPAVTDSATGYGLVNDNIFQRRSRSIDMRFYWVRDRFRQGKFLVYWMAGYHNLEEYFAKNQPTIHHWIKRSTYLFLKVYTINYACSMSPNELWGCVGSLTIWGNGRRRENNPLLRGKETDDGQMETNGPIRHAQYWRIQYMPNDIINLMSTLVYKHWGFKLRTNHINNGYHRSKKTPGIWTHGSRLKNLALVVGYFWVTYPGK